MSKWGDKLVTPLTVDGLATTVEDSDESCSEEYLSTDEEDALNDPAVDSDSSGNGSLLQEPALGSPSSTGEEEDGGSSNRWCSVS
jgi:hypothetical protein